MEISGSFAEEEATLVERMRLLHEILDSDPVDRAQPRGIDLAATEEGGAEAAAPAVPSTGEAFVDQRGNDPFHVLVRCARGDGSEEGEGGGGGGDASSSKESGGGGGGGLARIELENKHVPWDVFIPRVCAALRIPAVDIVRDASGAQVTSVEYLNNADELVVAASMDGAEPSLAIAAGSGPGDMSAMVAHIVRGGGLEMPPFVERAKYIPIRLTLQERKALRLLKSALAVSDYTDKIDRDTYRSKARRTHAILHEICAMISAVVVAWDYDAGVAQLDSRDFQKNATFIRQIFEIGRRHKIMNPEKLRSDYGKLIYMLQDSSTAKCAKLLDLPLIEPVRSAYQVLEEGGAAAMLDDDLMETATRQIADDKTKPRHEIQRSIKAKERAIKTLSRKYATNTGRRGEGITPTVITSVLYSMGDNSAYLGGHALPVERMIRLLTKHFSPSTVEDGFSLAISSGSEEGARLTHSHTRQFHFVLQSLLLWRNVTVNMFKLWFLAEEDLCDARANPYALTDTGQGLQRVQQCPRVLAAMREILHDTQRACGTWIGSSVIHLGDHNVPNALMFIDKYTQVSRIVGPIVRCIDALPRIISNAGVHRYIKARFGSIDRLTKMILADFFRSGFDGAGADNFFDAGSCIDGRLTSAWNWCSQLQTKPFWHVFKLTGFVGFDGESFQ